MVARARSRLTLRSSLQPRPPAPLPLLRARAWRGRGRRWHRRRRRALPGHRRQRREAAATVRAPKCSDRRRARRERGSRHCRRHCPSHSHAPDHGQWTWCEWEGQWAWCRRRPRLGLCLPGAWRHTRDTVSSGVPARRRIWPSSCPPPQQWPPGRPPAPRIGCDPRRPSRVAPDAVLVASHT